MFTNNSNQAIQQQPAVNSSSHDHHNPTPLPWFHIDPLFGLDRDGANKSPFVTTTTSSSSTTASTCPSSIAQGFSLAVGGSISATISPSPSSKKSSSSRTTSPVSPGPLLPPGFDLEDLLNSPPCKEMDDAPSPLFDSEDEEEELVVLPPRDAPLRPAASSRVPIFRNPGEAADYLRKNPRMDLDLAQQQALVHCERSEKLQATVNSWQSEAQISVEDRHISIKILVHEAANRSLAALKQRSYPRDIPLEDSQETYEDAKLTTFAAWKCIEQQASADCLSRGYKTPQGHLSCMCIFNPDLIDTRSPFQKFCNTPLPCSYGETDEERNRRGDARAQTLRALRLQQVVQARSKKVKPTSELKEEEKPSLFLKRSSSSSLGCSGNISSSSTTSARGRSCF